MVNSKGRVLFVLLPSQAQAPDGSLLRVAAGEAPFSSVSTREAALNALDSVDDFLVMVSNAADHEIFVRARKNQPRIHSILLTDQPMHVYSSDLRGEEDHLIDHVVANRLPLSWSVHELRVTLQKIIRNDVFGLEKYLAPQTAIHHCQVTGSIDREPINQKVSQFVESIRLGQHLAKVTFGISEELLMNAIYDAPVAGGKLHYQDLPRHMPIALQPDEYATLSYGCDGSTLAIGIADPFGALTKLKLFQYLKKVMKRHDSESLIDTKKGGAGLGFFKVLYSSHSLVCNVQPGKRTEVIALTDVEHQLRDFAKMVRSIHYFGQI